MIPETAPHPGAFSYPSELSFRRQPVFSPVMLHSATWWKRIGRDGNLVQTHLKPVLRDLFPVQPAGGHARANATLRLLCCIHPRPALGKMWFREYLWRRPTDNPKGSTPTQET